MQIRVLFEELLLRFPDIKYVKDPVRIPSNFLAGISELKVSI
jgi:cytochrome P450